MKKALFLFLFITSLLQSCNQKKERIPEVNSDKMNSVSVIIDEQLWNGEVGDTIRKKFASPVIGLPQEEPLFTINQYPVKFLEGYMAYSRNIIVVKKEAKNHIEMKQNEYRTPQNVVHISGKTTGEISKLIQTNAPIIIEKIRKTEIAEIQRLNLKAPLDNKKIRSEFKIDLNIPLTFKYALEKPKFIWFKKEITSGNTSILIYEVPISAIPKNGNVVNSIVRIRDSIGNLYIHGTVPKTKMITENSYSPFLFNTQINGRETYETRGTWELNNDYMSGPFINYCILDTPNNRILVLEGFCYAPSKQKRDLMLELEAIIKSIQFLKTTR